MASFTSMMRCGSIITAVFLTLPVSLSAQVRDGIAAIVNTKVITFSEVKKQVEPTERILRDTYSGQELVDRVKEARLNSLKSLIERELIIQDFSQKGFFIPESIIEDRLKEIIQSQFDGDRTAFIRTMQANGLSVEQYKQELRDQTVVQAMRQKNVSSAVIISPYKIERYYQDNIRDFTQEEQFKLSLIFMRKALPEKRVDAKGAEETYDPAQVTTNELLYKLDTGADFAELARSYSEGPKREKGGDLGWESRGNLRNEIVEVADKLQPGQHSRVVVTADGYYIVRLEDTRRSRVQPMSEVRAQIEKQLIQEDRQRLQQDWLDSLRSKAFIKMF